jgi:flagellar hook-length control protein FliK
MQLALFPPNLPGPLKQALGVLEALPGGLKALESAPAEGDFWMRLATQLQGLEQVAGALPQDQDAEALAAWLAACLGGEPLPQGGEDLPVPAPEAASRWLPGTGEGRPQVPWLGGHLPAMPVHASTPAPDGMPGHNPPGIQITMEVPTDRAAGVHARPESALVVAPNPFAAAPAMDSASVTPPAPSPTGLARMFQLDVPLHQPGWDRALGDRVQWMASQKVQVAELRLNPPNLGPLEVRVHVEGDRTHINFLTPQAAVRDAIDAALPRLREMFAESGLNLGDVTVSHQDARQAGGDRGHGPGQAGPGRAEAARADGVETGRAERLRQGLGLVDYYA